MDIQTIKDKMDSLNKVMMEVSQKLYQTNEPNPGGGTQDDSNGVEEAEFEEV